MIDSDFDNSAQQPPPSPEYPLRQRKDVLWQQMHHEFSQITDRLGIGIDSGIMETVVTLSVLGVSTRRSCEGHLEWSTGAPWVDVEAVGPKVDELEKKSREVWDRAKEMERNHAPEKELGQVFTEANRARREAKVEHLKVAIKVMNYLDEFYKARQVPADRRLILTYDAIRLESQGAAFQDGLDPESKQQKLAEYQEEMRAFTAFLKERYYADDTPIEPGEELKRTIHESMERWEKAHGPAEEVADAKTVLAPP